MRKERNQINRPMEKARALIVSYSYSGNTHQIAQTLQMLTGGDWFEIHPWQPYPMAFPKLLAQVKAEVRSGYHPRLLPLSCSPRPYQVVFVGSPNWCGTIAPPLASWLYKNNLDGKILLPFYSHCGGALGNLQGNIAKLCPKADVREALGVIGDGGEGLSDVLYEWLVKNGLTNFWTFCAG